MRCASDLTAGGRRAGPTTALEDLRGFVELRRQHSIARHEHAGRVLAKGAGLLERDVPS